MPTGVPGCPLMILGLALLVQAGGEDCPPYSLYDFGRFTTGRFSPKFSFQYAPEEDSHFFAWGNSDPRIASTWRRLNSDYLTCVHMYSWDRPEDDIDSDEVVEITDGKSGEPGDLLLPGDDDTVSTNLLEGSAFHRLRDDGVAVALPGNGVEVASNALLIPCCISPEMGMDSTSVVFELTLKPSVDGKPIPLWCITSNTKTSPSPSFCLSLYPDTSTTERCPSEEEPDLTIPSQHFAPYYEYTEDSYFEYFVLEDSEVRMPALKPCHTYVLVFSIVCASYQCSLVLSVNGTNGFAGEFAMGATITDSTVIGDKGTGVGDRCTFGQAGNYPEEHKPTGGTEKYSPSISADLHALYIFDNLPLEPRDLEAVAKQTSLVAPEKRVVRSTVNPVSRTMDPYPSCSRSPTPNATLTPTRTLEATPTLEATSTPTAKPTGTLVEDDLDSGAAPNGPAEGNGPIWLIVLIAAALVLSCAAAAVFIAVRRMRRAVKAFPPAAVEGKEILVESHPTENSSQGTQPPGGHPLERLTLQDDEGKTEDIGEYYLTPKLLGKGGFGEVYLGVHKPTGNKVAVKRMPAPSNSKLQKALQNEADLVMALKSPSIVEHFAVIKRENTLFIVMEYMSGALSTHLRKHTRLPESQAARYLRCCVQGLKDLHSKNIVHRDIKPGNMLIDGTTGDCKLSDFGTASARDGVDALNIEGTVQPHVMTTQATSEETFQGTLLYSSPELLEGKITRKVDIWAVGVSAIEMLTGKNPFLPEAGLVGPAQIMIKVMGWEGLRQQDCEGLSANAQSFLRLTLAREPDDRPTAKELLGHPFVQPSMWESAPTEGHGVAVPLDPQTPPTTVGDSTLTYPSTATTSANLTANLIGVGMDTLIENSNKRLGENAPSSSMGRLAREDLHAKHSEAV